MTPTKLLPQGTRGPSSEAFRHWLERAAPLLVVLLAAALRLYRIDYAQYRGDDDMIVSLAFRLLHFGESPLHGVISSLGVDNGPVSVYLLALPLALGADEVGVTVFIVALNTLAVALTYLFVRSFFSRRTALVVTLLFALNPWAVVYSRRARLNANVPLFTLLFMWGLLSVWTAVACRQALGRSSPLATQVIPGVMLGLSLSAVAQVHLSGMVHLVTAGVAALAGRMWRAPRMLLAAGVTFAATFAPYLLTTVVPGLLRVLASLPTSEEAASLWGVVDWERTKLFFYLLTNRGYQSYASQGGRLLDTTQGFFALIDGLVLLAFAWGALVALRRALHRGAPERMVYLLLLAWVALPMVFLAPPIKAEAFMAVFPFYYLVALPAPFILVAFGWRFLREPDQPYMTRLFLRDMDGRSQFIHEEVAYPAAYWHKGDSATLVFLNRFWVPIPPETPPGEYELTLGLVSIADWQPAGEAVVLGRLQVEGSSLYKLIQKNVILERNEGEEHR
jgi:4-amino-4-deoxy-L-arabinose transferase-like glycosyltransferase